MNPNSSRPSADAPRDETLAIMRGAVDQCRRRVEAAPNPDDHLDALAASLTILTTGLMSCRRLPEALAASQEAVKAYRRILDVREDTGFLNDTSEDPDAFRLASSLTDMGHVLTALGRSDEALLAAQEAVDLYQPIYMALPEDWWPASDGGFAYVEGADVCDEIHMGLADALDLLGASLFSCGRYNEALVAQRGAIDLFDNCSGPRTSRFCRNSPTTWLINYGMMLSRLGHHAEAAPVVEQAIYCCRDIANERTNNPTWEMAHVLGRFADLLITIDRCQDAAVAAHQGLTLIMPFAEADPGRFRDDARRLARHYTLAGQKAGITLDSALVDRFNRMPEASGASAAS